LKGALFGRHPSLLKLYADSGYRGPKFQNGMKRACRQINVEIVKCKDVAKFVVLPKPLSWFACKPLPGNGGGGRADHRPAQSLSPPGQGQGMPEPKRAGVSAMGRNSLHAPEALPEMKMILA